MNRPSIFRWLSRWAIGSVVCLTLLFMVLAVVNIVDFIPYGLAVRRVRNLTADELKSLASATTQYEKAGHQRLIGDAIPKEFRPLRPIRVDLFPGSTDVTLLERGGDATIEDLRWNRYVFLRISTSANNQTIESVTYAGIHQRSQTLWERNPNVTKRFSPPGRIVTISTNDMHSSTDWVVLPSKLLVIERSYAVGQSSEILAEIPLTSDRRQEIDAAIRSIGADVRGHAFDSGAIDGIGLRVSFSSDGAPSQHDDIVLANTWRSEIEPLIRVISDVAGDKHAITFANSIRQMDAMVGPHPTTMLRLDEYDRRLNPILLPWWCWWPRLSSIAD